MFFPLMKTPELSGFLDLVYFPPNNWENRRKGKVRLYALWPEGDYWRSEFQCFINFGERIVFTETSLGEMMRTGVCLIYPSRTELEERLHELPAAALWTSDVPEWRATSGFKNSKAQTSYQSEIFPLPEKGSMLTFHPFIQYGQVKNRLLILNITKSPKIVQSSIELYDSKSRKKYGTEVAYTNSVTTIDLDKYNFTSEQLPAFVSKTMAGIPFGLGIADTGSMLSMEHTHPPASFVLFGNRNAVQSIVKKKWFENLGNNVK